MKQTLRSTSLNGLRVEPSVNQKQQTIGRGITCFSAMLSRADLLEYSVAAFSGNLRV